MKMDGNAKNARQQQYREENAILEGVTLKGTTYRQTPNISLCACHGTAVGCHSSCAGVREALDPDVITILTVDD